MGSNGVQAQLAPMLPAQRIIAMVIPIIQIQTISPLHTSLLFLKAFI